jgi:hypothetical protein
VDGMSKAIELGAPYTKAKITIILKEQGAGNYHWLEP